MAKFRPRRFGFEHRDPELEDWYEEHRRARRRNPEPEDPPPFDPRYDPPDPPPPDPPPPDVPTDEPEGNLLLCGPDVSKELRQLWIAVRNWYDSIPEATWSLVNWRLGLWWPGGLTDLSEGWDILEFFHCDKPPLINYAPCGTRPCACTVMVDGECWNAGDVNYILMGWLHRLISGFPETDDSIASALRHGVRGASFSGIGIGGRKFLKSLWEGIKNDNWNWSSWRNAPDAKAWYKAGVNGWPNVPTPPADHPFCDRCPSTYVNALTARLQFFDVQGVDLVGTVDEKTGAEPDPGGVYLAEFTIPSQGPWSLIALRVGGSVPSTLDPLDKKR